PFVETEVSPYGAIELTDDLRATRRFKVNGQRLKPYEGGENPTPRISLVLTDS
ncbi:hypothetical protein A2U01_0076063, partial [Trifolium medium]|nr:hypothetical protein [Trifolium medium]